MVSNKKTQTRIVKRRIIKKKSKKKKVFILSLVFIAFLSVFGYGAYLYIKADNALTGAYDSDGREKSDLRDAVVDPKFDNVSVLIMGVDASEKRGDKNVRTDALMLATLNKKQKSVKLVSIPRDSYVYIPEVNYETRINHAHSLGGPRATIETVENLFEIPVDYYVKVNFETFMEVVDAVDGITVDVPYEFKEQDSTDKANSIHLLAGEQELNGEEALALARTRKLDNDIERGKRQQEIIKAIIDKTISLGSVFKYDDIIDAVANNITTDMKFPEMKSFISYGTSGTNLDIESLTLAGEDYKPGKMYFWKLDEIALEETKEILQKHLEIKPSTLTDSESDSGYDSYQDNASSE